MTRRMRWARLGRGALAAATVVIGATAGCRPDPGGNERGANNALGADSAGSATTGTGVGPGGYAPPGQGGALGDTMQGRLPPAGGQAGPAPGASRAADSARAGQTGAPAAAPSGGTVRP